MAAFPILARGPDDSGTGSLSAAAPVADLPPDAQIILPVRNFVLFPGVVLAVAVDRPRSIAAAQQAVREASSRRADAARRQRRRTLGRRSAPHRHGRQHPALRQRADGTHHRHLAGRTALSRRRVRQGAAVLRRARCARSTSPRSVARRSRRAFFICKAQALEALKLLPQVPQELARRRADGAIAGRSRRSRCRISRHRAATRSRKFSRRSTSLRGWTRSRACWPSGSRCCG